MKIVVKNLKGTQFELEIQGTETVRNVKEKIAEEQKIDVDSQKLVCVGKVMADDKTVDEYKLKEGDFIVVMVSKPKVKKEKKPEETPAATTSQTSAPQAQPTRAQASNPPAPVPNPSSQPAPANAEEGSSGFMKGEELEKTLKEMQDMGFPRDECMRALRAAYYNPDRAVDYLLGGIPEEHEQHSQPTSGAHGAGGMGGDNDGDDGEGGNPLAFLQNNPMFAQLRQRLISEPQFFQTFMNQLAQTHPQLHQSISANPQAFLSLLLGNGGDGMGGAEQDPPGTIRVTPEEKDAIDRLTSFGFPKHRAIEAFFSCDKNEEWAANFLFENVQIDDNYEDQLAQEESQIDDQYPEGDAVMHHEQPGQDANPPAPDNMSVDPAAANNPANAEAPAQNEEGQEGANAGSKDNKNNEDNENDDQDGSCL